jgi:hypothetical protein
LRLGKVLKILVRELDQDEEACIQMIDECQAIAFNKVTSWLTERNFKLENLRRFPDPDSEVKFYCEVRLMEGHEKFFQIVIADQTKGSILLRAVVYFDKNMIKSFNLTHTKIKRRLALRIRSELNQLGIKIQVNGELGNITLDKLILIDSIVDKQRFFEDVQKMIKGMFQVNRTIKEFTDTIFSGRV